MGFFSDSLFFGAFISLVGYMAGAALKKRLRSDFFNPLLFAILFVIAFLTLTKVDYDTYSKNAIYISYLLTPATICLALPLYEKRILITRNLTAIITGIFMGVISSISSVLVLSSLLGLSHLQYVTFIPKSITTAIGMGVSEELGGMANITAVAIIITGIIGNIIAEPLCRILKIEDPIARGIAIGSSSHAIGTTKAMEIGETEGAMSGLAIALAGLLTVVLAPFFANII